MPTSAAELQGDGGLCEYRRERQAARASGAAAVHPSDPSIALTVHQPLYPPGRIIHVVRHHPSKGEQVLNKHEPVYQAVWANTTDFDEVLISPVMIQDHMPDNVLDALNKVITTVGPAKPRRASACASSAPAEHLQPLLAAAPAASAAAPATSPGSPKASTPPHRLCLETSFTSLQSPSSEPQQLQLHHLQLAAGGCAPDAASLPPGRQHATAGNNACAGPLAWEFPALLLHDDQVTSPAQEGEGLHDEWFGLAPLATPESLSEVSSISSRASWLGADGPAPPPPPPPSASTPTASTSASASVSASAAARPANSSGDELSFASARQTTATTTATSSDDWEAASACASGRRTASSDAFLSVQGTPTASSSDDSVTATVEVHLHLQRPRACAQGGACSDSPAAVSLPTPARCSQLSPQPPAGAAVARPASVADVTAPNSVKQVKFSHKHRGSTVTASAVRQAISCDRAARGDHLVGSGTSDSSQVERLDNNPCRSENNNNNNSAKTAAGRHAQQNSARSTPAVVRSRRDCRADRQALESLPLLSSITAGPDRVPPYPRKKYMYPITAVGKGESSV